MEQQLTRQQITPGNYREYDAINYSLLKRLNKHPSKVDEEIELNEGMIIGDAIDLLAFTPEKFNEKYYTTDLTDDDMPSDNIKDIVHLILEEYGPDGFTDENVLWAAEEINYGQSWNPDTIVKKVMEGGGAYASMKAGSQGKTIISREQKERFDHTVNVLQTHGWTAKFFNRDYLEDYEDIFYQVPMLASSIRLEPRLFQEKEVWYKGLADIILVNHRDKVVYPWDLKNTGQFAENFTYEFISRAYYLQAAQYYYLLDCNAKGSEGSQIGIDVDIEGYEIAPFGFIISPSNRPELPLLFRTTQSDIELGTYGGTTKRGKPLKGFVRLTEDLLWHTENDLWDYSREVYESDGELELDIGDEVYVGVKS